MTPRIVEVEAVLKTADEWVAAQETLVAARQVSNETAVDRGGSRRYRRLSAGRRGDAVEV